MDTVTTAPPSTGEMGAPPSAVSTAPSMPPDPPHGSISPARITAFARILFIILALLAGAYLARAVVLPMLLAIFASVMLQAPVRWLRACRLPTPVAAAIVVCIFVAAVGTALIHLGRPTLEWIAAAPGDVPRLKAKFQHVLRPAARLGEAASSVGELGKQDGAQPVQPVEVKDNRVASRLFTWTGGLLAGAGEMVGLLFLLLASGDLFLQKLVKAIPRLRDKKRAVEISREIQQSISTYLLSVGLINLGFGVVVGVALYLLGMPNAMMWGGVAAFANCIPYIGPILAMLAVTLAGLLAFDTLGRGLLPVGVFAILHLVESYAVTPFVLGRRFAMNPVVIFITLIFCAWLWSVIGALLAIPLLVTTKVICDRVAALNFIGELLAPHEASEAGSDGKGGSRPESIEHASTVPHAP